MEYKSNAQLQELEYKIIDKQSAKRLCVRYHYMKTYPVGAYINIGIYYQGRVVGVCVFGYSTQTIQKAATATGITFKKNELIEMQRLWISDEIGSNAESYSLGKIISLLKQKTDLKLIITHAGGCKNDCGIVYQSSSWLYFGRTKCKDFFLTDNNEYKNITAAMRFGRVSSKGKTAQQVGEELFGTGNIVDSYRYYYIYPLDKGLRRILTKKSFPYVKDSEHFRRNQEWVS